MFIPRRRLVERLRSVVVSKHWQSLQEEKSLTIDKSLGGQNLVRNVNGEPSEGLLFYMSEMKEGRRHKIDSIFVMETSLQTSRTPILTDVIVLMEEDLFGSMVFGFTE